MACVGDYLDREPGVLVWLMWGRLEVWANRRVIAVLGAMTHQPEQNERVDRTNVAGFILMLVVVGYFCSSP